MATALMTLLSGIGATAAVENPSLGTRVDYINPWGHRVWSTNIQDYGIMGQALFQITNGESGWYVTNSQTTNGWSFVKSVKFIPWGTEANNLNIETEIPTEYYVKSSKKKPRRINAETEMDFNALCGDTVVLVMELPDKAYPNVDLLYRYTAVTPDGEERWLDQSAVPFASMASFFMVQNPRVLTDPRNANWLDQFMGSEWFDRLPANDKSKNRWAFEFIMPNEPISLKIDYDYADGKILGQVIGNILYSSLYTQFGDLDFNGNTGENWVMRYFGDGLSQEQISNLTVKVISLLNLSILNKANPLINAIPWADYYCGIILSNYVLDRLDMFDSATEAERENARAQLLSLRAHCYTRILQIYGNRWQDSNNGAALCAPLLTDSKDINKPLSSMKEIKDQIYSDLDAAIAIFKANNFKRDDLLQPDLNVARGLKMRAAILAEDWNAAKQMAEEILTIAPLSTNEDMLSGFYTRRDSWLWGAQAIHKISDDHDWQIYYWAPQNYSACNGTYTAVWGIGPNAIDRDLWLKIPANDMRRNLFAMPEMLTNIKMKNVANWYNSANVTANELFFCYNGSQTTASKYVANQYKEQRPEANAFVIGEQYVPIQYVPIPFGAQLKFWGTDSAYGYDYLNPDSKSATVFMRSDEVLLAQAEACFMLGDEATALQLVNKLNMMRGSDASASKGQALLDEIRFTRRIELWGEGFGFFDQKRWNLPMKRNIWKSGDTTSGNWPAPLTGAANVAVSAANGWRAPIPAYYLQHNPNIDITKMGYTGVTGYETQQKAPAAKAPATGKEAKGMSKEVQKAIQTSAEL